MRQNMSNLQTYTNEQFGSIRTVEDSGNTFFCARDIATILGYSNTTKAVNDHCRGITNRYPIIDALGRTQEATFITESDVYRLIVSSHLPTAEQFERWLFDEVVPSIRKHGLYATPQTAEQILNNPDLMIEILQAFKEEKAKRKQLEEEARINKPMVEFAQSVTDSQGGILIREMAKLLAKEGLDIGGNRLINRLEEMGLLCKTTRGTEPTQVAVQNGWLIPKESTWLNRWTGRTSVNITAMVTGKGQRYLYNKFMKESVA